MNVNVVSYNLGLASYNTVLLIDRNYPQAETMRDQVYVFLWFISGNPKL
ncbi:hypothetical protein [Coleofasciculus sp. G3-WIS-01]